MSVHAGRDPPARRPRLVLLADVSLSVRATARFTLHLVHGLQDMFGQVRSFAFVSELTEVTDLFADHTVEDALGLIFVYFVLAIVILIALVYALLLGLGVYGGGPVSLWQPELLLVVALGVGVVVGGASAVFGAW